MLKRFVQQDRRELGDRSVPLGYPAGRRAAENAAGRLFQHSARAVRLTSQRTVLYDAKGKHETKDCDG